MRAGQPSRTALFVAAGRAIAHAEGSTQGFADPIARQLLPVEYQRAVDLWVSGRNPSSWSDRTRLYFVRRVTRMARLRTVAIDDAVRAAPEPRQLIVLGAGLDARAWRMNELRNAIVFEVDHPATQSFKREKTAGLPPTAREVRFVPVDLQSEALDVALGRAGHDAAVPTVWIWEGVVRYLTRNAVGLTLDSVARCSAPGSRLIANYTTRSSGKRWLGNLALRALGEPIRFRPQAFEIAALLTERGFEVVSDTLWGERENSSASRHLVVAERTR